MSQHGAKRLKKFVISKEKNFEIFFKVISNI
jgi:hypothetical protein